MPAPGAVTAKAIPLNDSLSSAGSVVAPPEAEHIAKVHYGLSATAKPLAGEKDSNFHLRTERGEEYLLKVVNPGEDPSVSNFQTMALLHIASRDPGLPVQRVLCSLNGAPELRLHFPADGERTVRMVSFSRGTLQSSTRPSAAQRRNVGRTLARLQVALADFVHPAADHDLTWDLKHSSRLRALLSAIDDVGRRSALASCLDGFDARVSGILPGLRTQVVHNDLSGDNVVVDPDDPAIVTGILDFGDMVRTPAVIDAAVGASYQLQPDGRLEPALDFLSGFHAVRPLEEAEIEILYDLIVTRTVMRIAIPEWRAARFPDNREYILRNIPSVWSQFESLRHLSRDQATAAIRRACETTPQE